MEKIVLLDAKEKLSKARENNEGFSDEIYEVCDYLAIVLPDEVTPRILGNRLIALQFDLICGYDHSMYSERAKYEFHNLVTKKEYVIPQIQFLPQLVDQIADEKFVIKFREYCRSEIRIDPPVKKRVESTFVYPEYVDKAVKWWVNAIQSPELDIGEKCFNEYMIELAKNGSFIHSEATLEEFIDFYDELAYIIYDNVVRFGKCRLIVQYDPMFELAKAAEVFGENSRIVFPFKTSMEITSKRIMVQTCRGKKKIYG